MARVPANPNRTDPYKNFKFRVNWDGQYVAGVSKVSGLERTQEVVEHRAGRDNSTSRKSTGRTKYDPLTLERGVTFDSAFAQWADNYASGPESESSLADYKKNIILEMYDEGAQLVICYQIFNCWVSEYRVLSDLDASANAVCD